MTFLIKSVLVSSFFFLSQTNCEESDISLLLKSAQKKIEDKQYKDGILDYKTLNNAVKSKGIYLYYISKYSLVCGDTSDFLDYINQAITYSPQYYNVFKRDTLSVKLSSDLQKKIERFYLESRKTHEWLEQMNQIQIDTLRALSMTDQYHRKEISLLHKRYPNYDIFKTKFDSVMKLQVPYDEDNQKKLDAIIAKYGFPDLSNTTMEGLTIAHTIIQHCKDVKKRQYYLTLVDKSVQKHNFPYQFYATMIDRTLVLENKDQEYGTEVVVKETNQDKTLSECDRIKLNNKRISYGLNPIE